MSKYAKLRQLAEKASPGPWIAYINRYSPAPAVFGPEGVQANSKGAIINWPGFDSADTAKAAMKANARFIAAANPVAVSRLIDDYDALATRVAELEKDAELYRRLRNVPDEQLGAPGVPCVAVPAGPSSGRYVSREDLDAAMQQEPGR